jgi:hypothetical protein
MWVKFGGPDNGKGCYLWPMAIWNILQPFGINVLWPFGNLVAI